MGLGVGGFEGVDGADCVAGGAFDVADAAGVEGGLVAALRAAPEGWAGW